MHARDGQGTQAEVVLGGEENREQRTAGIDGIVTARSLGLDAWHCANRLLHCPAAVWPWCPSWTCLSLQPLRQKKRQASGARRQASRVSPQASMHRVWLPVYSVVCMLRLGLRMFMSTGGEWMDAVPCTSAGRTKLSDQTRMPGRIPSSSIVCYLTANHPLCFPASSLFGHEPYSQLAPSVSNAVETGCIRRALLQQHQPCPFMRFFDDRIRHLISDLSHSTSPHTGRPTAEPKPNNPNSAKWPTDHDFGTSTRQTDKVSHQPPGIRH